MLGMKDLGAYIVADGIVHGVADDGRGCQQENGRGDIQGADGGERAHRKEQRVAGQERCDHQAGLAEDDDEQDHVHPDPVGCAQHLKVLVDVQDKID